MTQEMDDKLFEDVEYDEDLFEDKEYEEQTPREDISGLRAGQVGLEQGATFGFSDELASAIETAGQAAGVKGLGADTFSELGLTKPFWLDEDKTAGDIYEERLKEKRSVISQAEQEQPGAMLTGELLGSFAAPLPGVSGALKAGGKVLGAEKLVKAGEGISKAGQVAKDSGILTKMGQAGIKGADVGAAGGALYTTGKSEDKDLSDALAGAGVGAAGGGVIGAGVQGVGTALGGLKRGISNSDFVTDLKTAFRESAAGRKLSERGSQIVDEIQDQAKKLDKVYRNLVSTKGKQKSKELEKASRQGKVLLKNKLIKLKKEIDKLPEDTQAEAESKKKLIRFYNQAFKRPDEIEEVVKQRITQGQEPEKALERLARQRAKDLAKAGSKEGEGVAEQSLLQQMAKEKAMAEEAGKTAEFTPVKDFVDPVTGKRVKTTKAFDTDGEVDLSQFDEGAIKTLAKDVQQGKIGPIEIVTEPSTGAKIAQYKNLQTGKINRTVLPERTEKVKEVTEKIVKPGDVIDEFEPTRLEELISKMGELAKPGASRLDDEAEKVLLAGKKELASEMQSQLGQAGERIAQLKGETSDIIAGQEALTGKGMFDFSGKGKALDYLNKVTDLIKKSDTDFDAQRRLDTLLFKGFSDPVTGAKVEPLYKFIGMNNAQKLMDEARTLSNKYDIAAALNKELEGSVSYKGLLGGTGGMILRGSELAGDIYGKHFAGAVNAGQKIVSGGLQGLRNLSDNQMVNFVKRVQSTNPEFDRSLQQLMSPSKQKRDAALFLLMQQPKFREIVEDYAGENEEEIETNQ